MQEISIFWFRRDLRIEDNIGLEASLKEDVPVMPIFIFDKSILDRLPKDDARVSFIDSCLQELRKKFLVHGSSLAIYYGTPLSVFEQLSLQYKVHTVHTNRDYEPYALERDQKVKSFLNSNGIDFRTYKDQVIFEKDEIIKSDGKPYVVYTPYKNKWKEAFQNTLFEINDQNTVFENLMRGTSLPNLSLGDIGFTKSSVISPDYYLTDKLINNYSATRDFPGNDSGTSKLGVHLRFGTVSIRKIVSKAIHKTDEIFLSELIWREFFMQILWHFPKTKDEAFRSKYDRIEWRNNEEEFEKWKTGMTGYPLVDAGMRQLNKTGYMHNRVRMLTASFLCKHLLIDWRWGEAYFAEKLLDYDMSANVGNWQWAAGSGVDAAPYFRIFNPTTQIEKFDKQRYYIKQWVNEFESNTYPSQIVDHKEARLRCLEVYKAAVS